MARKAILCLISVFSIGAAFSVSLAQDNQDTRALAAEYLDASGGGNLGEEIRDAVVAKIQAQPGVPPGFVDAFKGEAKPAELRERLITIYAKTLDAATLKAGIDFYGTPAGKKIAQAQPQLSVKTREASDEWTTSCVNKTLKALGMKSPRENLEEARRNGNETACIGALKTIGSAQALFREADKDGNNEFDYAGDLAALGKTKLIDAVLASGVKNGYTFKVCRGSTAPEFLWMAVASPVEMGKTGSRHFATNHQGIIFYSKDKAIQLDTKDCKIVGGTPVGR